MKISKIEALPSEVKKLRVAAYCRVSTASSEQEESLEAQKEHYETYIKRNPKWECAGVFHDFGLSGTSTEKREGLQSLLKQCRSGQVDFILIKSISRLSRNTLDCLSIVRELIALNIPIFFERENFNTCSMESELLLSILSRVLQLRNRSQHHEILNGLLRRDFRMEHSDLHIHHTDMISTVTEIML